MPLLLPVGVEPAPSQQRVAAAAPQGADVPDVDRLRASEDPEATSLLDQRRVAPGAVEVVEGLDPHRAHHWSVRSTSGAGTA